MSPYQMLAPRMASWPSSFPPSGPIGLVGVGCLGLAFANIPLPLIFGFAISGGIFCLVASILWAFRKWTESAGRRLRKTTRQLLAHDGAIGLVTDGQGVIDYANNAAVDRFEVEQGWTLSRVFGQMLANPASVLEQISKQAAISGAATEDIVTRRGHFRMRVLILGADCQLWWLDDLSDGQSNITRSAQPVAFPMLSVTSDARITQINKAFQRLVGDTPKVLADVFTDLPLRSGQAHTLRGSDGFQKVVVAELAGKDGGRDIYVLPGPSVRQSPPVLEAGWDALEDLPVPLLKIAKDGTLLASNREARQLLHIECTEGRRLADVLDGPGRPINDWLVEALDGRSGHVSQFLRGRGENQDTFVQVTLNTSGTADDAHLIAVLNDVTEIKTLEAQFVQGQKMQAIGQLAGGVAHDFNNLLTAISGHCDLLLLRHDEGDQNYGDLIQIHQNANRAASLVGQLLAFSRKQNLRPETIDLRDTLSDLTHLLNRLVGEKVTLMLDHDPALLRIKADKRQLEQVLMNLVVNARDAMEGAGLIKVVTENRVLKMPMVRDRAAVPPGEYVVVSVIDKGHGIAADKLHKIFEPFYTTKRTGEGTGLGLSTAYGIVKQTGGYIFADSVVGEGTTFSLYFPSHTAQIIPQVKIAPALPEIMTGKVNGVVLLVEDEAPVRAFASRALRLRGYTVLEADSAETALEMLGDDDLSVDIFVTDVIMPGLDGPTWVRQALKQRPKTKVVFVSGYPEDAFDDGQPQIPNAIFLPKPFSLSALTQTVQGQLQQPSMSA